MKSTYSVVALVFALALSFAFSVREIHGQTVSAQIARVLTDENPDLLEDFETFDDFAARAQAKAVYLNKDRRPEYIFTAPGCGEPECPVFSVVFKRERGAFKGISDLFYGELKITKTVTNGYRDLQCSRFVYDLMAQEEVLVPVVARFNGTEYVTPD